jgi:uncharacterized Zn finger protein
VHIKRRIDKLELLHPPDRSCAVCGYPKRAKRKVILSENDDTLPQCESCGQPLDEDGVPLCTPLTHIVLVDRFEHDPQAPN